VTIVTEFEITVRSTDMDGDRVVNNARYFEYFEQARLQHLQRLGIVGPAGPFEQPARPFAIAETRCRYRSALAYGDVVLVRVTTTEVRNRSFVLGYEMVRRDDGRPVAEGMSAQVWLDEEGRAAPLPPTHRESLLASCQSGPLE
jgi:acyl-CoA thioester hydrolase